MLDVVCRKSCHVVLLVVSTYSQAAKDCACANSVKHALSAGP